MPFGANIAILSPLRHDSEEFNFSISNKFHLKSYQVLWILQITVYRNCFSTDLLFCLPISPLFGRAEIHVSSNIILFFNLPPLILALRFFSLRRFPVIPHFYYRLSEIRVLNIYKNLQFFAHFFVNFSFGSHIFTNCIYC